MVKERRKGRHRSSSSDSDDSEPDRRRKRSRSNSPKGTDYHSKRRPKVEARRDEMVTRIKREPLSDSDQEESRSETYTKQERDSNTNRHREDYRGNRQRHERSDSDNERRNHRHRPIKQERPDSDNERRNQRHRHIKQEQPHSDDERRNQHAERRRNNERRQQRHGERQNNLSEHERYGRRETETSNTEAEAAEPKDAPNFELSGKLTEDTNTYKGIVIKYNEPPEARKPKKRWRLYPFKNDEPMKPFHMHRQSAYLLGRERLIADIPIDHPSCSKQHAVYQYRMVPYEKEDGRRAFRIAPYIIDLGSANGTFVNNKKIEAQRYVELMEKDVVKFGFSSREYVLLHDKSDTTELEDESD